MESKNREVKLLVTRDGKVPFEEWLNTFRKAPKFTAAILVRIERASLGNFGDWKAVGEGVNEMRIDFGPGLRVYYAIHQDTVIILLAGGKKSSQDRDIDTAIALWKDHKDEIERFQRDI